MADDSDDDKKNEPEIKNTKDDAQVKNDLNSYKDQLTATTNPAELARLVG